MGRWKKYVILAAASVAIVAPFLPLLVSAIPPPLVIYGFVLYEGHPVEGVVVEAINEMTGERVSDVSEENGAFVVTLGNPPYEWSIGDKITLRATKDCLKGLLFFTIESDKPVRKNITLQLTLEADFNYEPVQPIVGEKISFFDNSSGAMKWFWDFGDGNTSYEKNPEHIYEKPGTYNVTLTISCNGFNISVTKQLNITAKEENSQAEKKTPSFLIFTTLLSILFAMFIRHRCIRSR